MNDRIHHALALTLFFSLIGCDDAEETPAEPPATEAAPTAAEAPPEPGAPEGWEELEVQVQGNAVTVLAPAEEREVDAGDWGTAVSGRLPGQTYPYNFSLKYHDEAPPLRMLRNVPGLEQEDTDFGFRAELREEDGNGWTYVVYNEAQKLSCVTSLHSTSGVSDELIAEARRPCDRLAE